MHRAPCPPPRFDDKPADSFREGRAGRLFRTLALWALVGLLPVSAPRAAGTNEWLVYHEIQIDDQGMIIPWYSRSASMSSRAVNMLSKAFLLCGAFFLNTLTGSDRM